MGLKNGVTTIKKPEIRINTRKKFLKTDRVRIVNRKPGSRINSGLFGF